MQTVADSKVTKRWASPQQETSREVPTQAPGARLQDPAQPWMPDAAIALVNFFGATSPGYLGTGGI